MMKHEIEIPEGIEASVENNIFIVKGPKGELKRTFKDHNIVFKVESGKILLSSEINRKKTKAVLGTWCAHVRNMITGVNKGWKGELKIVYSHFPVKLKTDNNMLVIENFIGGRSPRTVPIPEDLKVEIKGTEIFVSGTDKERVGQLCASIEQVTKVKGFDRRIFQDGAYITKKPYAEGDQDGG
ncbi:MAG: 50S ribosomal protein L6 [Candidatus Aenigmarchaeota archaeon]|nr:50S ribosomal protein L6 [Candidatus Aenigmarchaeota archaeon]